MSLQAASAGGHLVSVAGSGIVVNIGAPGEAPAALAAGSFVCLPAKPSNVVLRQGYFERLTTALVEQPGVFLLGGPPGSGKSTIAQMFAWQVEKRFQAVVYQTCGRRSVESIAGDLADALRTQLGDQVGQLPADKKLALVRGWLEARRSLLILDDVWLADARADEAALKLQDLVPGKEVSVLFTSRRPRLPVVEAGSSQPVDVFTPAEAEETFCKILGKAAVEQHKEALRGFADRVKRLPVAVSVGAQLLQGESGPLDQALARLKDQVHDEMGLLRRAIQALAEPERRLLDAAAACSLEGFWFPLAVSMAGLDAATAATGRNRLVNAGLMRVLDQDRQRFQLHALIGEEARALLPDPKANQEAHAVALERVFQDWEKDWKDCRECLDEVIPALSYLWRANTARAYNLTFRAFCMCWRTGEPARALEIEKTRERFGSGQESFEAKNNLLASYGNQAIILQEWGRLNEAMDLLKKVEGLCLELGNKNDLRASYGNQALIMKAWGRLDEAMALHKKEEALCGELRNKDGLQVSYGNQALILQAWGRLDEAMDLHKKQESLCLELGNKDCLQASYGNQALILQAWGRLDEAMDLHKKQESLCLELGNKDSLQICYGNQGRILHAWGQLDEAMALHKKKEALCLELGNKDGLQRTYGNQAIILQDWGRQDEAMALYKKQESLCLELGSKDGLQLSYGGQAVILQARGRQDEAMALHKKEEALCVELGNKDSLQRTYGNQALILKAWGRQDEAMALHKKQEALCLELGKKNDLKICYGNQAALLNAMGRQSEAAAMLKKRDVL